LISPSGFHFYLSKFSSWLYSTLITNYLDESFSSTSLQMAPNASPGTRGQQTELNSKLFTFETPRADGMALRASEFVSYRKIIHSLPIPNHFLATPESYRRLWMSPCPCGFVITLNFSLLKAIFAELSKRAGTFSYLTISTLSFPSPNQSFFSNSAIVLSCVSPDTMMQNGT
jgi:hypothetical protein